MKINKVNNENQLIKTQI